MFLYFGQRRGRVDDRLAGIRRNFGQGVGDLRDDLGGGRMEKSCNPRRKRLRSGALRSARTVRFKFGSTYSVVTKPSQVGVLCHPWIADKKQSAQEKSTTNQRSLHFPRINTVSTPFRKEEKSVRYLRGLCSHEWVNTMQEEQGWADIQEGQQVKEGDEWEQVNVELAEDLSVRNIRDLDILV